MYLLCSTVVAIKFANKVRQNELYEWIRLCHIINTGYSS